MVMGLIVKGFTAIAEERGLAFSGYPDLVDGVHGMVITRREGIETAHRGYRYSSV
jgi:hypothetical protein